MPGGATTGLARWLIGPLARWHFGRDTLRPLKKIVCPRAPALPGGEAAYLAVHRALVIYDAADSGGRLASKR